MGQINVYQGGTGKTSFPAGGILVGDNAFRLTSTTSPTVGYITATSTTATSTFPNISLTTAVDFLGDYVTNGATWIRSKISETIAGISYNSTTGVFSLSADYEIPLTASTTHWEDAYGWGDHSTEGYLTTESDPVFLAHEAYNITTGSTTNWQTAFDWGNHADEGYLTSYTESDPIWVASSTNYYTKTEADANYDSLGQATSTMTDHTSTYNHANYDTAYGWGDHDGLYDTLGQATSTLASHTSTYNHDNYDTFYNTPSNRITDGDHLSWVTNTLNVDDDWWDSLADMTLATGNVYVGNGSNNPEATSTIFVTEEKVGFGTTTPAYTLDVYGDAWIENEITASGTPLYKTASQAVGCGWIEGGVLATSSVSTTTFAISAGTRRKVDYTDVNNPIVTYPSWSASTSVALDNLTTEVVTIVGIDIDGNIAQYTPVEFTPTLTRCVTILGSVQHADKVSVQTVSNFKNPVGYGTVNNLSDLSRVIGALNESGNLFTGASTTVIAMQKSIGITYQEGSNADLDHLNPNFKTHAGTDPTTFFLEYQDGSDGWTVSYPNTSIDPALYDDGDGTLGNVAVNQWVNHRVFHCPGSGNVIVAYGQNVYVSAATAQAALLSESFVQDPAVGGCIHRAWLSARGGGSDATDSGDAVFTEATKFGAVGGGGLGSATANLQDVYNNSPDPEIILTELLGGISITDASTPISDSLFEISP